MKVWEGTTRGDVCTRALIALVAFLGPATFPAHSADPGLAKVTAVQNTVESKAASAASWSPSVAGESLKAKDRIRTGPGSRASILYSDQTLHRMNEKSEVEILPPADGGSGIVKIFSAACYAGASMRCRARAACIATAAPPCPTPPSPWSATPTPASRR